MPRFTKVAQSSAFKGGVVMGSQSMYVYKNLHHPQSKEFVPKIIKARTFSCFVTSIDGYGLEKVEKMSKSKNSFLEKPILSPVKGRSRIEIFDSIGNG